MLSNPDSNSGARHARHGIAVASLLAAATLLCALPATAQSSLPALLDGLVDDAWHRNVGAARQDVAMARARAAVREADGRRLPTVGVNARYSEYTGVLDVGEFINPAYRALNQLLGSTQFPTDVRATLPFRQETRVELAVPLFDAHVGAGRASARAGVTLASAERDAARRQLAHDIQQAWLGYATASQLVDVLEATRAVLDEQLRVSERLVASGSLAPDAVLRARADRSELEQQLAEAAGRRDAAQRSVNLLRNADEEAPVPMVDHVTMPALDSLGVEPLLAHALAHREELVQADGGVALASAQERLAGAATRPSVALAGSYGVQGEQYRWDPSRNVGLVSVVFAWPLLNGTQDAPRREQARALRSEATLRRAEIEAVIRVELRNAFDGVQVARAAHVTADDRSREAERAFSFFRRRYAEGLVPPVEFLSARTSATAASLNAVVARFALASRLVALERVAALRPIPQ
jgi:outer membrane protein TolC